ncbi:hypothetical protein PAECIP111893_02895 [Paenibacillus plantiphilus]|uniref:Uncharacterized protein n=1 Tax=Paenibacillus plantiphilus TaxID=2905650 RepID=A0ABM9CC88_9BACL|nr:hypothetical protein [Paenibacillus plantiphilus]CAH1208777.1 hypothetical protein PAECIP111893_02895 [Paenibacillus plantiphilus]
MGKSFVLFMASFRHMRIDILAILAMVVINSAVNIIVHVSIPDNNNTQVSLGNLLTILLIVMAISLPLTFFRRVINLGATRKQYYSGLIVTYSFWAALFSLLNIVWLKLEVGFLREYIETFNIIEIFHWDQFNVVGMFLYQFGAYMLLISILNLLCSCWRHVLGWVIWILLIAAISIGTSIASLRSELADGLLTLLFNDSLVQGFGLTMGISLLLLAAGWWFTSRRTI